MSDIEIILPEREESIIEEGLCEITEAIQRSGGKISGGFLGGAYGYGGYIDNEVFMMHPYCWCEKDDCGWCGGETFIRVFNRGNYNEETLPNFHYKLSDLKIWWYKYIGRGMNFNRVPTLTEWDKIKEHCLSSLSPSPTEKGDL